MKVTFPAHPYTIPLSTDVVDRMTLLAEGSQVLMLEKAASQEVNPAQAIFQTAVPVYPLVQTLVRRLKGRSWLRRTCTTRRLTQNTIKYSEFPLVAGEPLFQSLLDQHCPRHDSCRLQNAALP